MKPAIYFDMSGSCRNNAMAMYTQIQKRHGVAFDYFGISMHVFDMPGEPGYSLGSYPYAMVKHINERGGDRVIIVTDGLNTMNSSMPAVRELESLIWIIIGADGKDWTDDDVTRLQEYGPVYPPIQDIINQLPEIAYASYPYPRRGGRA